MEDDVNINEVQGKEKGNRTPHTPVGTQFRAHQETTDAPEISDVPRRVELRRRYRTVPLTVHVPPWQDEFLTDAARIFGRPKSEFVRAALVIIINRIVEKYGPTNPEVAKLAEMVPK